MPLEEGRTQDVVDRNIRKLVSEGFEKKRAIAIAYRKAGIKRRVKRSKRS